MNMNEAYNKRFNAIKNGKPYTFDYKKAVFAQLILRKSSI